MSTYFSILQAILRPETGEYLAIGLLVVGEGRHFFEISDEKVKAAKSLLSPASTRQLNASVHDLEKTLKPMSTNQDELFSFAHPFTNLGYLDYSSRYHNNLLRFTSPEPIQFPADQTHFLSLFKLYVYNGDPSRQTLAESVSPFEVLKEHFYPNIKDRVNLNVELTRKHVQHLFMPTHVDLIGKNDLLVIGREIQFSKRHYYLGNDLKEIYSLVKAIEEEFEPPKVFLIGDEPPREMGRSHGMWQDMRNSKFLKVVPVAETDQIEAYVQEHGVEPFLDLA